MANIESLNPEQREAVEAVRGPVLILAGAGTGKTRVITFRIAHMIDRGIAPGSILAVTFTNKAAREMQERVTRLIGSARRSSTPDAPSTAKSKPDRPTVCTFHSLCVRILRDHIERLGYKRNFVIFDQSEQLSVIKKILSRIFGSGTKVDAGEVLSWLSRARNGMTAPAKSSDALELALHVRDRYESALKACNAVDFDDLILLALRLLREHPDVLKACRDRYRYIMVDEYQDTNAAQFELVHALAASHRNFCVVGDDDQSIYGWRGAEIANLLDLEKHFPEVRVVKLEQNYRSTTTILKAANAVIKHNTRRRGKQLWSDKGSGTKIQLACYPNEEEEARTLAETIEFDRKLHRIPWRDQAILFRTNIQARPIETALRKAGIRYHLIGGQSFFDRREIRDLLAYLKVFLNPHDDISLLRIANVPARGLSDATMERLLGASQERKCSVYSAMRHTDVLAAFQPRAQDSITTFSGLIEAFHSGLETMDASELRTRVEDFLKTSGYADELRHCEKDAEAGEARVRNLLDLTATLADPESKASPGRDRLESFLDDLALDRERIEEKEATGDVVTLITVHSCKGLEFPRVSIVGIEQGLLPHSRSLEEGTLDEERRLFYVALTRAMKSLSLSHCAARRKYGQSMPCHPSQFLAELPADLIEHADDKAKQPVSVDTGKNMFASMLSSLSSD